MTSGTPRYAAFGEDVGARRVELDAALRNAEGAQAQFLKECVTANVQSAFGRDHDFASIHDAAAYRRAVPIRTYDDLAPYVERSADGELGVLTTERPLFFARTSGTTGAMKKIPLTATDLQKRNALRTAEYAGLVADVPDVLIRDDAVLSLAFDWKPPTTFTKGGAAHTAISSMGPTILVPKAPPWFRAKFTRLPRDPSDYFERLLLRMRYAVEADIRFLYTLNPSTLLLFAKHLFDSLPALASEVRTGTVRGEQRLAPNPERAAQLEAVASQPAPTLAQVWPKLRSVGCWTAGAAALYVPALTEALGDGVTVVPTGVLASEGVMSISAFSQSEWAAGLLPVATQFFEFVPVEHEVRPDSTTLLFNELEAGRSYHMIFTQASGFYRYAIGDIVRVTGHVGIVPRIEFVGRDRSFSSFTGEKITEIQIVAAMHAARTSLGLDIVDFVCCPTWGEPPYYAFIVEPRLPLLPDAIAALERALDDQLGHHNDEWPSKRSSGRLGAVRVAEVAPTTFARYWKQRVTDAASPTQVKRTTLAADPQVPRALLALSAASNASREG